MGRGFFLSLLAFTSFIVAKIKDGNYNSPFGLCKFTSEHPRKEPERFQVIPILVTTY